MEKMKKVSIDEDELKYLLLRDTDELKKKADYIRTDTFVNDYEIRAKMIKYLEELKEYADKIINRVNEHDKKW